MGQKSAFRTIFTCPRTFFVQKTSKFSHFFAKKVSNFDPILSTNSLENGFGKKTSKILHFFCPTLPCFVKFASKQVKKGGWKNTPVFLQFLSGFGGKKTRFILPGHQNFDPREAVSDPNFQRNCAWEASLKGAFLLPIKGA